jgi:hypothetical protein
MEGSSLFEDSGLFLLSEIKNVYYIAKLVKAGEKVQLRYEEMVGGQVFFNLQ